MKCLFKNESSCLTIKDNKIYIISIKYKDYSPRAIQVIPGFQIELGRDVNEFIEAIKQTRLPVIIKKLLERDNVAQYQIIRMHTGSVEDKIVANLLCEDSIITRMAFNRLLIKDNNYKRYNTLSAYHQLTLGYNLGESGCISRSDQVRKAISAITLINNVEVKEDDKRFIAKVEADGQFLYFNFILNNKTNRYELSNISIRI